MDSRTCSLPGNDTRPGIVLRRSGLRLDLRRAPDGGPDTLICAAAADVAGHRGVDVRVRRPRLLLEQRGGRHDLAGLAVAALRDVELDPRLLDGMAAIRREAFDRRDRLRADGADRHLA